MEWNSKDCAEFRHLIKDRLRDLEQDLERGESGTDTVELDQQTIGRLSRQDALINQAMSQAQQSRREIEKTRLKRALERLDEDEYGYCEDCGETIARKRLLLDLAATRCVECAAQ